MKNYFEDLFNDLNTPPENITPIIEQNKHLFDWKGYGTPELEMKYLHRIFLTIQNQYPDFKSFSWEQYNSYNDNYYHFQVCTFTVNEILDCDSDLDFYFDYHKNESISPRISISHADYPSPDELEYAIQNNLPYGEYGISEEHKENFWEYEISKYKHLKSPCLKFLVILKLLEVRFSMYYFLYCFGHGVRVTFTKESVSIIQMEEKEIDGQPLGVGMRFDEI